MLREVPYVDTNLRGRKGTLIASLALAGDQTRPPDTHVIHFDGDYPCFTDGSRIAAPLSTIDLATKTGADIPVEERSADEVHMVGGSRLSPLGVAALNRAFDVTPAALVTAIVTELGVARPPYDMSLRRLVEAAPHRLHLR